MDDKPCFCAAHLVSDAPGCGTKGLQYKELAVTPSSDLIGKVLLDRYEIQELVGEGGVSRVYRAVDNILKRNVAVKILTNHLQGEDVAGERFLREARLTSGLSHPNILPVFDFGRYEGNPFIVCQYHTGVSLQDWLFSNIDMPAPAAVKLFIQIASGLAHAHESGILHRDLKPNNVMLTDGTDGPVATIIDFGLLLEVNQTNPADKLTRHDAILGTPCYVSPEQCLGKVASAQSDVYSLGCLMYETLVGVTPFCGDTALETMHMHLSSEVKPMDQVRQDIDVPLALQQLVTACLAKNPAERPSGMREVIESLRKIRDTGVLPPAATDNKLKNEALIANKKLSSKANLTPEAPNATPPPEPVSSNAKSTSDLRLPLILAIAVTSCGLVWFAFAHSGTVQQNSAGKTPAVDVGQANSSDTGSGSVTNKRAPSSAPDLEGPTEPNTASASATKSEAAPVSETNTKAARAAEDNPEKLAELAAECHARGDCDDALTLLQRSVKVSQRIFGPKSKQTRQRMKDLAVLHMALGNQTEANDILKELGKHKEKN